MKNIENVKNITISEETHKLITLRAEFSVVFKHLLDVIQEIDPHYHLPSTNKVLKSFCEAEKDLMNSVKDRIDEVMLTSEFENI